MLGAKAKSTQIVVSSFFAIHALLPFHAFFTTWAISNLGAEVLIKSWKELLLLIVVLPVSIYVLIRKQNIAKLLWSRTINKVIAAYVALNVVLALAVQNGAKAEAAGLAFNLRFFAMFVLAQIVIELIDAQRVKELAFKIVFIGGLAVIVFGALQVLLLPADFLRHFGYSQATIPAYFTVDSNENLVRILSTLRGPNALGAYLVFWLPVLAMVTKKVWSKGQSWQIWAVLVWAASLVTLYGSRSRSAWLAAVSAVFIFVFLSAGKALKKQLIIGGAVASATFLLVIALQWNSTFVQSAFVHRDPGETSSVNSDDQRFGSLIAAKSDVLKNPLGGGPGSAGLASTYGDQAKITENYYLQVGQELGLLGAIVFIAINVLAFLGLWAKRSDELARVMIASFVALGLINLLLPAWGDETVSMLWWGMAAVAIYVSIKRAKAKKRANL